MSASISAKGHNGQVEFDGMVVTITRRGFIARMGVGKGEKRIPLRAITAVQWKPAGPLVNGFIQFTIGGGNERRSRWGHQTETAAGDENSVVFMRGQQPDFEALRAAIDAAIAMPTTTVVVNSANGSASELERLIELRRSGALTDREFTAAKAKLLGL